MIFSDKKASIFSWSDSVIKTTLAYIVCDGHVLLERNKREKDIHKGKFVVPGESFFPEKLPWNV